MKQKSNQINNLFKMAETLKGLKLNLESHKNIADDIVKESMNDLKAKDRDVFDKIKVLQKNRDIKGMHKLMKKIKDGKSSNNRQETLQRVKK